jgi:uncharacterized repeat protein (TIGR01451 family)
MKKIIVLLFIFIYGAIQAQIIDFPDENLKNALLDHSPAIDMNNNGEIEVSEAVNFTNDHLFLQFKNITNITGLENFTSIERFILSHNDITSIDISVLFWVKDISLNGNELTEIDLSSNIDLEKLSIGNNELSNIDISNNENLTHLSAGGNDLTTLDTSNNLLLEDLGIWHTEINTLDLSLNNLKLINISSSAFTTFEDFSSQMELENIDVGFTDLSTLNTSIFQNLKKLNINGSNIIEIDLSQNPVLQFLTAGSSGMTTVDISHNLDLRSLFIWSGFTSIDVSQNLELRSIQLLGSDITSLDLSANPNLCTVNVSNTSLEYINIKNGNNINPDPSISCDNLSSAPGEGITIFNASNNDNLAIICVDDISYALEYFNVPDSATLLESCPGNLGDTNQIVGTITYDENENGCDPDDQPVSTLIHSTDGVYDFATTSALTGDFNLHVFEETYDTQLLGLPDYFTTDPIVHQNTFTGFDQTENIDFCITSTTTIHDLSVTLIPISQARPGFESSYQIMYTNIGTTTVSGTVDLSFDEALVGFETSDPNPTNTSGNTISWDFVDFQPFTSRTIDLVMLVEQPPIVEGDDVLQYTASISPNNDDQTPNDNTFELNQIVVNSFDPNDKTCLEGDEVLFENAGEYLHYLVRFQNTGSASAINIRVADQLDEKLDWTTLVVESLSHPGRTEIQNGRDLSFIFDDINLPHEDTDPEGSNGFIAFKIKPKTDVVLGDTIENTAFIFFDFNPPIITNTTNTTFVDALSIEEATALTFKLYPNPVSDILTIESATLIEKVTLLNMLGQVVKTTPINANNSQIDMSSLQTGLYFIKTTSITGTEAIKQIIKE